MRCSTNWAMKPLTLGADQLWVHMLPWEKRRSNPGNKGEWIKTIIMTCNVVTVECKCSCKKKAWKIQAFRLAGIWTLTSRGSRGGARGGPPLFLDPKHFWRLPPPPLSQVLDDCPPPTLSEGLDPPLLTSVIPVQPSNQYIGFHIHLIAIKLL